MELRLNRFGLRLALPALGIAAMLAFSDPLPGTEPAEVIGEQVAQSTARVREEAEHQHLELTRAARNANANATAASMRWLITLPAGRRCVTDCGRL
ncbi:MAG TPA: hypothetical protein VFG21_10320 [Xanthomonadaceae bacterium]|nr:hypothetical protein [Xanthomonadaceae bacterium]